MTVTRIVLLAIISISLATTLGVGVWRTYSQGPTLCAGCNIVVISLDALPNDAVDNPDSPVFSFPLLRERALTEGSVFSEAHTSTKQGWLANVMLLSGIYPWELGMWRPESGIPRDVELLPETLQTFGYDTAGFTRGTFVDTPWGFNRGFTTFSHTTDISAPDTFTMAKSWLAERDDTSPFFLFIQPTDLYDWFKDSAGDLSYTNLSEAYAGDVRALSTIQRGYVENMSALDIEINEFQNFLTTYTKRPTIVAVVGTYGDEFLTRPERGIGDGPLPRKNWLHVPLVLFVPHMPARDIPSTVEIRSLPDTLRVLVGARTTFEHLESLVPYIEGKKTENSIARAYAVATDESTFTVSPNEYETFMSRIAQSAVTIPETRSRQTSFEEVGVRSLISGPWHILSSPTETYTLFNTVRDPFEEQNIKDTSHLLTADDKIRIGTLLSELSRF